MAPGQEDARQLYPQNNVNLEQNARRPHQVEPQLRDDGANIHQASRENAHHEPKISDQVKHQIHNLAKAHNNLKKVDTVNASPYPQLASNGKFVPSRRIVHLDLKGGAYKVRILKFLFID